MTIFDFLKVLALDREAEALSSASARMPTAAPSDELDEEELDLLSAATARRVLHDPHKRDTPYG